MAGYPGMPAVIRREGPGESAPILGAERHSNIFTLRADHLTFRGLDLGPSRWNEDGFRIHSRGGITIERCRLHGLGGIAVVATHNSVHGLVVRGNVITGSEATGMYFGCHEGNACVISGLVVEENQINGVRARDPEIGYGLQVKLNSVGVIRGNVIVDTKGPGIMVYGSRMPDRVIGGRAQRGDGIAPLLRHRGRRRSGDRAQQRGDRQSRGGHRARGLWPAWAAARGHRRPQYRLRQPLPAASRCPSMGYGRRW